MVSRVRAENAAGTGYLSQIWLLVFATELAADYWRPNYFNRGFNERKLLAIFDTGQYRQNWTLSVYLRAIFSITLNIFQLNALFKLNFKDLIKLTWRFDFCQFKFL